MENRLFKKLFAIALSLAFAFSFTGCQPDIHIHTGGESSYDYLTASENKNSGSEKQNSTASQPINSNSSGNSTISKSEAKSIALKDAGLNKKDIYDYEIELDRDYKVLKYEVSFESGGHDYDYEIDAKTGKILNREIDMYD